MILKKDDQRINISANRRRGNKIFLDIEKRRSGNKKFLARRRMGNKNFHDIKKDDQGIKSF